MKGEPFNTARVLAPRILLDAVNSGELNPCTEIHLMDEFEVLSAPQSI